MKNKESIQAKALKEGTLLEKEFTSYQEMAEHAPEWSLSCNYLLRKNGMGGRYKILELPNIQLSRSDLVGGFMFSFEVPKARTCLSLIEHVEEKACFERIKLSKGQVIFFDDRRSYNFMSSGAISVIDVALKNSSKNPLLSHLSALQELYCEDSTKELSRVLNAVLSRYSESVDEESALVIEDEITKVILELIRSQEAKQCRLTKGEQVAIAIRDQVFGHMDRVVSTEMLAQQYQVTSTTLQNAFKSLFGHTPQHLLRLLKLNHVHHELYESTEEGTTVIRVAQKWGFRHMGRFTAYYRLLFDQKPSETLREKDHEDDGLRTGCVERTEEMR